MTEPLWTLRNVSLPGDQQRRLDDLTIEIPAGRTAVIGYSGAGKTSLLNLLAGFERPAAGAIKADLDDQSGRLPLYWVPQDGGLWNHLTVLSHLEVVRDPAAPMEPQELLEQFGLSDRAAALPQRLSQGQRDRLAVARALAADARVLVMDEPLASVDPARLAGWFDVIGETLAARASSLVFSSHHPEVVLRHADSVICLDRGRCVHCGPVEDLYHNPPSHALGRLLGDGNWISTDEAALWLDRTLVHDRLVRPERLRVEPGGPGGLVVESSRVAGPIAQTTVRHTASGQCREFLHITAIEPLKANVAVRITTDIEESGAERHDDR